MKILAVHPIYPANREIVYLPMGLAMIAAVAEREGHEVRMLDMHNLGLSYKVLEKELAEHAYDLCMMGGFALQIKEMRTVTKMVKQTQPRCQVILGGVGVSVIPEVVLNYTGADAVSLGEAELTFVDVLRSFVAGRPFEGTVGFAYRKDNRVVHAPKGSSPQNLDELPWPAYHLFDVDSICQRSYNKITKRSLHLMTSRGCPFHCDFCINSVLNNRALLKEIHGSIAEEPARKAQRFRSAGSLVREIEHLKNRYGIQDFYFADEEFITHPKRLYEICDAIEPLKIVWSTSGRADWVTEEKLARMKRAGCQYVIFGIESGSQDMLDRMEKKAKVEAISRGIEAARSTGMNFIANFMVGHPGESERTIQESVEFCKRHRLLFLPSYVTLFPNSKMFHEYAPRIKDWDFYFEWLAKTDYSRNYFYNLTDLPKKRIVALRTWGVAETVAHSALSKTPKWLYCLSVWLLQVSLTVMDLMPALIRRIIRDFFRYTVEFVWLKAKNEPPASPSRQIPPNELGQKMTGGPKDAFEESMDTLESDLKKGGKLHTP